MAKRRPEQYRDGNISKNRRLNATTGVLGSAAQCPDAKQQLPAGVPCGRHWNPVPSLRFVIVAFPPFPHSHLPRFALLLSPAFPFSYCALFAFFLCPRFPFVFSVRCPCTLPPFPCPFFPFHFPCPVLCGPFSCFHLFLLSILCPFRFVLFPLPL